MAGNIKGITVEIGGDTTKLDKALKTVNTSSRSLQKELNGVNKSLKLDPQNLTLIKQKQDILTQSITNTGQKLNTLKTAESQVQEQFKKGDISIEQYRAFQKEIENTKIKLQGLSKEAKEFGINVSPGFLAAKDKINEFGNKATETGKKLLPVSVGIAAIGFAASKVGIDFEYAMSDLSATSGATGEDFDKLKAKSEELGATTCKSATDSAQAMKFLALAGYDTNQILSATEPILKASVAWGADMATSADLATDSMSSLGLTTDQLTHYLDVCSQAQRSSNTSATQMMEAYIGCGGTLRTLGVPLEESATLLGRMADQGKKGSEAGNALNSILVNLTGGSSTASGALDKLGISAWDSQGNFIGLHEMLELLNQKLATCTQEEKTNFETAIGGKTQLDTLNMLLGGLGEGYDKLSTKINNCDGVTEEMYSTMNDNERGSLASLSSAIESLGIKIYEILKPAIASITEGLTNFAQWLGNLDPGIQKLIVGIGALVVALGPALIFIGKISMGISSLMGLYSKFASTKAINTAATVAETAATEGATIAQGGLNLAFLACPITWIIAGIVALVATFVILWNKCDAFREFWINLWETIKITCSVVGEWLNSFFTVTIPQVFNVVVDFVKNNWQGLLLLLVNPFAGAFKLIYDNCETFRNFINNISIIIRDSIISIWQGICDFFSSLWNTIKDIFTNTLTAICDFITTNFSGVIDGITQIWDGWLQYITNLWELIKNVFLGAILIIIDIVTGDFSKAKEDTENIWNNCLSALTGIWEGIKTIFNGALTVIAEYVTSLFNLAVTGAQNIWNSFVIFMTGIWTALSTGIQNAWSGFLNTITNFCNNIMNTASNIWNNIVSTISGIMNSLPGLASSAFTSMCNSISSALSGLGSIISNGFSSGIEFIKALPGQAITWGKDFIDGLVKGIKSKISDLTSSVTDVASNIRSYLHFSVPDVGPLTDYETWMPDFMDGLSKGIEKSKNKVVNSIRGLATDMSVNLNSNTYTPQFATATGGSNPVVESKSDLVLNIENFNNNRNTDVKQLMQEAEFYRKTH
ncbi:phage tail tape measure protein [Clostridium botulinum]|nr:phage tail tape measure protein [Clostridium botulinum]NFO54325.1 phage tail tape measure protein [Clostridium botulinum]